MNKYLPDSIIQEANNSATYSKTTQELEAEVRGDGSITALSFYSNDVHIELLYTPHAIRELFGAQLAEVLPLE